MRRVLFGLATAGVALLTTVSTAAAEARTDPYAGLATGWDISFPQCTGSILPSGGFGIVGVNGGSAFTGNPCFGSELTHAARGSMPAPSFYINTGYTGAYRRNITPQCSALVSSTLEAPLAEAWEIGCSEAYTSVGRTTGPASMWWLDVETGNSWSSSNVGLNQQAIQGAVDYLYLSGFEVGVYSTQSSWTAITDGSFTPNHSVADWVAGGSCGTPFDSNTVWLSQDTSGGFDSDTAC